MKVQLILTGRQTDEFGAESVTETKAEAEYYEKNGTLYIFYDETPEGTKAVVKNTIKFKNNVLEMTKKGIWNTRMVFDCSGDFQADYQTPFGNLQMDIHTTQVNCVFVDDLPRITAKYTLSAEGHIISYSTVTIKIITN